MLPTPELIEGQVLPEEGAWLRAAASRVPNDQAIVELGSYTGKSTSCLAVGSAEGNQALIFAVDLWTDGTYDDNRRFSAYDPASGEEQRNSRFSRPPAKALFNERLGLYDPHGLVTPIQGMTTVVAQEKWVPSIGLLFIDADHTYEAVRDDFHAWAPKVVQGGTIAMHDYAMKEPGHEGATRFVDELVQQGEWQIVEVVKSMAVLGRRAV